MSGESFRFIHASDFHLERPLGDFDALPAHLRDAMADAPRRAAATVFEAAEADNIDFLVLCGDLLNPQTAGPYGMSLLLDHFEALHAKKTPVFWSAGVADDPKRWPESIPLPPNVTLFPKDRVLSIPVERAGRTICEVVGRSSDGRRSLHVPSYATDPTDEFTVAVGFGDTDAASLAEGRFDYWALGGDHDRRELEKDEFIATYCGTPQGRSLQECGPHGYSMVDVDADQTVRIHEIDADMFRYCHVEIDAAEIASVGNIRNLLGERIVRLQHENAGRHLLIGWEITVSTAEMLQAIGDPEDLSQWLRREYGHGTPSAWTARLLVRPPRKYPDSWNDEDTILGDFLRAAEKQRQTGAREMKLIHFTEEHASMPAPTATMLAEVPTSSRTDVLDQATLLGVELLRGGKPNLVQQT